MFGREEWGRKREEKVKKEIKSFILLRWDQGEEKENVEYTNKLDFLPLLSYKPNK